MAHRPTFAPAKGGTGKGEQDLSKLTKQYSSRDLPSHTKIKYRQQGQESLEDVKGKDLKKALEEKDKSSSRNDKRNLKADSQSVASSSRKRQEDGTSGNLDADDPVDPDEDEDIESDEDDTDALMAELNKIKKEREAEKAKQEAQRKVEGERIRTESILMGNPLLNTSSKHDFKVKRRWDDDVVFKNCAKGVEEKRKKDAATFINDALRSEFHKKFMDKYIK